MSEPEAGPFVAATRRVLRSTSARWLALQTLGLCRIIVAERSGAVILCGACKGVVVLVDVPHETRCGCFRNIRRET